VSSWEWIAVAIVVAGVCVAVLARGTQLHPRSSMTCHQLVACGRRVGSVVVKLDWKRGLSMTLDPSLGSGPSIRGSTRMYEILIRIVSQQTHSAS
jgi:hypothetical protein